MISWVLLVIDAVCLNYCCLLLLSNCTITMTTTTSTFWFSVVRGPKKVSYYDVIVSVLEQLEKNLLLAGYC